jgi:hypothetical protein
MMEYPPTLTVVLPVYSQKNGMGFFDGLWPPLELLSGYFHSLFLRSIGLVGN